MVLPVTEYTGHTIAFPSLGLTPHRMMWFLSPSQYLFFLLFFSASVEFYSNVKYIQCPRQVGQVF